MIELIGIDEAGFGPILGPLIVSSSVFSMPRCLLDTDLWQVLRKSLSDRRKNLAGRLLITDSKKAYNKTLGLRYLQRTVLTCLRCIGHKPATFAELIDVLSPGSLDRLIAYPWHKDIGSSRIFADDADKVIASAALSDDMASNGISLLKLRSCCLDVAYYNRMVNSVKNKANVLFTATSQLIKDAFDSCTCGEVQIIVDRQGGRVRYRRSLQLMFPEMELKILTESLRVSSYELCRQGKTMRVHFVVAADKRFLPVSLASMVSKYLRELIMVSMNSYFASFCADLKPTAGYWQDGLRFVNDLKEYIPALEYDRDQLIRCR